MITPNHGRISIVGAIALSSSFVIEACGSPSSPDAAADAFDVTVTDMNLDTANDVTIDTPPDVPFDAGTQGPDLWVRYCAFATACAPVVPAVSGTVSACAAQFEVRLDLGVALMPRATIENALSCANVAADCLAFSRCLYADHGLAYCVSHQGLSCDGATLVNCPNTPGSITPSLVLDCAASGLECREVGAAAVCTNGASCVAGTTSCMGQHLVGCDATTQLQWAFDCALAQASAVCVTSGGQAACAPSSSPCTGLEPMCVGDVLTGCDAMTHRQAHFDCATHASHCGPLSGGGVGCIPNASACSGVVDSCSGSVLRACVDGVRREIDCRTLGLATCRLANGTAICSE